MESKIESTGKTYKIQLERYSQENHVLFELLWLEKGKMLKHLENFLMNSQFLKDRFAMDLETWLKSNICSNFKIHSFVQFGMLWGRKKS